MEGFLLLLSLIWDLKTGKISNWITLCGLVFVLVFNVMIDTHNLMKILGGIGVAFAILFPLFCLHMIGAGDVKLFIVLGAMEGVYVCRMIVYTGLLVGLYGILSMLVGLLREGKEFKELMMKRTKIHMTIPTLVAWGLLLVV